MKELKLNSAICCTSGGYKNVFTHGVLKAFEDYSMWADAYAACSSSVLIAAYAAFKQLRTIDTTLWDEGYQISQKESNQSQSMLYSINKLSDRIEDNLWLPSSSRLLIATSKVKTKEAIEVTQNERAKRQGQKLLIDALRHNSNWKNEHLELVLFDTCTSPNTMLLSKQNFREVFYATTRMLHAWDIPACIDNVAYIDGSYTASCLIKPLVHMGYEKIVYINTEHDKVYFDLFTTGEIPHKIKESEIEIIQPDVCLSELGVDYYSIKEEGLKQVFLHGYEKGIEYLQKKQ